MPMEGSSVASPPGVRSRAEASAEICQHERHPPLGTQGDDAAWWLTGSGLAGLSKSGCSRSWIRAMVTFQTREADCMSDSKSKKARRIGTERWRTGGFLETSTKRLSRTIQLESGNSDKRKLNQDHLICIKMTVDIFHPGTPN